VQSQQRLEPFEQENSAFYGHPEPQSAYGRPNTTEAQSPIALLAGATMLRDEPSAIEHTTVAGVVAHEYSHHGSKEHDQGRPKKLWEHAYDVLKVAEPGEFVHWEVLGEAVGKDATIMSERSMITTIVRRAIKELELRHKRTARNIRGFGYKILSDDDRLVLAKVHQQRAVKEIATAHRQVTNVDYASMEPGTRKMFEATAMALGHQQQVMERMDIRQNEFETVMKAVVADQRLKADEMTDVQRRLAALEQRMSGTAQQAASAPQQEPSAAPYVPHPQPTSWPQPDYTSTKTPGFPT
jgi:hypothetical protein